MAQGHTQQANVADGHVLGKDLRSRLGTQRIWPVFVRTFRAWKQADHEDRDTGNDVEVGNEAAAEQREIPPSGNISIMETANLKGHLWQKHCQPSQSADEHEEADWWRNSVPEIGKAGGHKTRDSDREQHREIE